MKVIVEDLKTSKRVVYEIKTENDCQLFLYLINLTDPSLKSYLEDKLSWPVEATFGD